MQKRKNIIRLFVVVMLFALTFGLFGLVNVNAAEKHKVIVTAPTNGTITVKNEAGEVQDATLLDGGYEENTSLTVIVKANDDFRLEAFKVNGENKVLDVDGNFKLKIGTADVTLAATFKATFKVEVTDPDGKISFLDGFEKEKGVVEGQVVKFKVELGGNILEKAEVKAYGAAITPNAEGVYTVTAKAEVLTIDVTILKYAIVKVPKDISITEVAGKVKKGAEVAGTVSYEVLVGTEIEIILPALTGDEKLDVFAASYDNGIHDLTGTSNKFKVEKEGEVKILYTTSTVEKKKKAINDLSENLEKLLENIKIVKTQAELDKIKESKSSYKKGTKYGLEEDVIGVKDAISKARGVANKEGVTFDELKTALKDLQGVSDNFTVVEGQKEVKRMPGTTIAAIVILIIAILVPGIMSIIKKVQVSKAEKKQENEEESDTPIEEQEEQVNSEETKTEENQEDNAEENQEK